MGGSPDFLNSRPPGGFGPRWVRAVGILPFGQFGLPVGHVGKALRVFGLVCI